MADDKKRKIEKEIRSLVIARLDVLPSDKKISIGSSGEFTKEELINHVQKGDDIGDKIVEVQMDFLQSLKEGIFYEQDISRYEAKT